MTSYVTPELLKALNALHEVGWVGLNDYQVKEALQEKHGILGAYRVLFSLKDFREKIKLAARLEAEQIHAETVRRNREYEKIRHQLINQYGQSDWNDILRILRRQYRQADSAGKRDLIIKWYEVYRMPIKTIEMITMTSYYHVKQVIGIDDGSLEDDDYDD